MIKRFCIFSVVILLLSIITACAESSGTITTDEIYGNIFLSYNGIRRVMNTSDYSETSRFGYIDEEGNRTP